MVESQGVDEFMRAVYSGQTLVVSVSPQARASLALYYGVSQEEILGKLITAFKGLNIQFCFFFS